MGLRDEWGDVIRVLREVIPVYDRVNHFISLGKAEYYRSIGVKHALTSESGLKIILDAGSGYGNMSRSILEMREDTKVVMLDPILDMLKLAAIRFSDDESVGLISGIFEGLPFRDSVFDAIVCGYSFRDAIVMRNAIKEFVRVLKEDGRLVIVDIGKPDSLLARYGAYIYLRIILPLIAFIVSGELGLKFAKIYDTYKRLPTNSQLMSMLKEYFKDVILIEYMLGASVILVAYK